MTAQRLAGIHLLARQRLQLLETLSHVQGLKETVLVLDNHAPGG